MKKVYICSPCRGDYENNIQRAKEFSRAAEIELARERGIPVLNGFKAISEIPEAEKRDEDPQDAGSVIIRVPAFRAMARCNEHLNHGPISIEVDGRVIIDLAKRLKENPGSRLEIGG